MADIIREQIMKNLITSLQAINGVGNYANTFIASSIQRFSEAAIVTAVVPYIYIQEGNEEPDVGPYPLVTEKLMIHLAVVTRRDLTTDTRSADEAMNSLRGDVYRAVMVDTSRGGLAINTEYAGSMPIEVQEGQPDIGTALSFTITYRHLLTNPASLV